MPKSKCIAHWTFSESPFSQLPVKKFNTSQPLRSPPPHPLSLIRSIPTHSPGLQHWTCFAGFWTLCRWTPTVCALLGLASWSLLCVGARPCCSVCFVARSFWSPCSGLLFERNTLYLFYSWWTSALCLAFFYYGQCSFEHFCYVCWCTCVKVPLENLAEFESLGIQLVCLKLWERVPNYHAFKCCLFCQIAL